jgi:Ser/Thr protein kinase RdoA (MazF antagonist)
VAESDLADPTTLHWIAKTHREGTGAVAEFRALSELIRSGFGHAGRFRVPRPICLVPDWRLFVEERAAGRALRTLLASDGSPMRRAAQWLRQLHSLPQPRHLSCAYDAERATLDLFTENLRSRQPELARYLDRQGARLREQMAEWRAIPASCVHGDFHPENIYLSEEAVTVIDFDRFAIGDPAKDLGSFMTQVRAMSFFSGLPARSGQGNVRAFLEEYVREIPPNEAEPLLDRAEAYGALFALEVAYYTLCVLRVSDPDFARKWFQYGTARRPGVERTQEQIVE